MKAFLFSFCYNILYTVGWLVTLPSYLLKQRSEERRVGKECG